MRVITVELNDFDIFCMLVHLTLSKASSKVNGMDESTRSLQEENNSSATAEMADGD